MRRLDSLSKLMSILASSVQTVSSETVWNSWMAGQVIYDKQNWSILLAIPNLLVTQANQHIQKSSQIS